MSEEDLGDMHDLWLELIADYGGHDLEYDVNAEKMWRGSVLASLGRDDLGVLVAELRSDTARTEKRGGGLPRIIGYLFFRVMIPPLRSKYVDHVYISDLVVERNFRRMGVASALMKGLRKELGKGPHRIYLRVPADNDAAVRFYGKHGFRISEYVMEMELEERAEG